LTACSKTKLKFEHCERALEILVASRAVTLTDAGCKVSAPFRRAFIKKLHSKIFHYANANRKVITVVLEALVQSQKERTDRIRGAGRKYNAQELTACALLLFTLLENEGLLKSPIKALQPIKNGREENWGGLMRRRRIG